MSSEEKHNQFYGTRYNKVKNKPQNKTKHSLIVSMHKSLCYKEFVPTPLF